MDWWIVILARECFCYDNSLFNIGDFFLKKEFFAIYLKCYKAFSSTVELKAIESKDFKCKNA